MVGFNADGQARDRVLRLMEEKDRIESDIRDETAVLESNNIGMHEPLVDDQGFPRGDIDVYKVRHARHRIICLQNDHKAIMRRIEQGLAEFHSQFIPQRPSDGHPTASSHMNGHIPSANGHAPSSNGHAPSSNGHVPRVGSSVGDDVNVGENDRGFAMVAFVHNGSPADLAGLCENDEILRFGTITTHNFTDITQIHDIVAHSVGQNIRVLVRRNRHIVNLTVSPRPWAQPGLLGCQINRLVSSN